MTALASGIKLEGDTLGAILEAVGAPAPERLAGAIVVVKCGGKVLEEPDLASGLASDLALASRRGLRLVIVHGGGAELTRTLARLGVATSFVDGHRVTCEESARVAEMVLSGRLNKELVARLSRAGLPAVGLSGTDGGLLRVKVYRPGGRDIGQVGEIEEVDARPLMALMAAGFTPVVSSTATDAAGRPLNINADCVAGKIAAALGARSLLYLSDVAGLEVDGERVRRLDAARGRALLAGSAVTGGMRPKLESALDALAAGVEEVHLIDGRPSRALSVELFVEPGQGTLLVPAPKAARSAPGPRAIEPGATGGRAQEPPAWSGTLAARGEVALMGTYGRYPIELVAGAGARVSDSAGRSYIDLAAGIAVSALGHGHPALVAALRAGADGLCHTSNLYWTEPMVRLAERLAAASGMERTFFCNSGTEAIEAAIKLSRRARPGRRKLVVFERSFHGRTLGALSATMQDAYQAPFRPLLDGVAALPFGDFDDASSAIDEETAAVLVEPIQGEGGVRPAPAGWLAHLRKACDKAGALLIFDEVQTGIGRTGSFFAYQQEGLMPDAVASAKALAGGLPIGALLARGEAATALKAGDHGSTFGGGPLIASVANAVLDVVLADGFLGGVAKRGFGFETALHALAARYQSVVASVRGRGLMWGVVLRGPWAKELVGLGHAEGVLTLPAGDDVLRLLPPLTATPMELAAGFSRLERAVARLAAHRARPEAV